ncbi:hypothetical protein CKO35_16285 [Ectothiorhodospira shaposhnikovii]|uniref:conjugal transfer protein TraG N-terminal domain-containing protein n=1 Tax=Ectothiorhodospira shaposhnikovii TaxID=1054 RepID=UPI001906907F|nr:conjugal transfer protein TraG N-terminal domain-containing protein [Ectothiorhodospira shaposhnikovii]MBK1674816.1 hypothetical protein [Ectothiorhodospira shaposhnikovii]
MGVDSYLELFTTLYGWQMFNNIWSILTTTGIAFIPFIVILIRNFIDVNTSMEANAGSAASVRRMEIEIVTALTVVVLAGQPALNLQAHELRYTPQATLSNPTPATVNATNAGTTYGQAGFTSAPTSVRIPLWWYGVMALSSGVNHAIVAGLPATGEMREMERALRTMYIENPSLRLEVNNFYTRCYVPARSKFGREQPAAAIPILNTQGVDDTDWMGSHVYRQVPGYYDILYAGNPVPGWPVNPARDTDQYWLDTSIVLDHGIPYCKEWWEHPTLGLRQKLLEDNTKTQRVVTWVQSQFPGMSAEQRRDLLARNILEQTPKSYTASLGQARFAGSDPGFWSGALQLYQGGVASVGLVVFYTTYLEPTLILILEALPFIQALTLMGVYALLPLVLVFGMYQPSILLVGAIGIFTVKFWAVLWHLALWADNNLLRSLYPDGVSFLSTMGPEHGLKSILLTMIVAGMYVTLPALWTLMMGWVGYKTMGAINSVADQLSTTVKESGKKGGEVTQKKTKL